MDTQSIVPHLVTGLVVRFAMLWYGIYQDSNSVVSYTDIDYSVYSDAARYVMNGSSPYLRETYRYTPVLAWILTPIWTVHASYGKIVFILFDLLTCYLIYLNIMNEKGVDKSVAVKWSLVWIYNPLSVIICTRGSSESIILSLVLAVLFFFQRRAYCISGLLYGFAVHFKPYTVPFCLPLYLASRETKPGESPALAFFKFNPTRIKLVAASVFGFGLPTALCYSLYGYEFLHETYLYHLTRKDIRHNFSLYFYLLYLNAENEGILLKFMSFLPQVVLLFGAAFLFPTRKDLPFTFFVQTCCFVIFNKVCTSQYFLWYLSLLPLIGPRIKVKWTHAAVLVCVWYFAQISWLLPAFYLEFEGRNTFIYIWLESIAFFCGNIGILVQLIKHYDPTPFKEANSSPAAVSVSGSPQRSARSAQRRHLQNQH